MPRIAEIDRAILAQLRKNGRMSYVDLASTVEASERTVRTHIRNMEENGTIRGYTIREGGVGLTALVRIKVSPGSEIGSFASEVTGWEGVEIVYEVSGEADLVALVHVDDTMALRALLDKMWLAAPNEIASTTTELVLEQSCGSLFLRRGGIIDAARAAHHVVIPVALTAASCHGVHAFHFTEQPMDSVASTAGVSPLSMASIASANSLVVTSLGFRGLSSILP